MCNSHLLAQIIEKNCKKNVTLKPFGKWVWLQTPQINQNLYSVSDSSCKNFRRISQLEQKLLYGIHCGQLQQCHPDRQCQRWQTNNIIGLQNPWGDINYDYNEKKNNNNKLNYQIKKIQIYFINKNQNIIFYIKILPNTCNKLPVQINLHRQKSSLN